MNLDIKEMVKEGRKARMIYYQAPEQCIWYETENGFKFPVPFEDMGTTRFNSEEKAMLLMKWIKKQLKEVQQ